MKIQNKITSTDGLMATSANNQKIKLFNYLIILLYTKWQVFNITTINIRRRGKAIKIMLLDEVLDNWNNYSKDKDNEKCKHYYYQNF